ncbi:prominin-1-A isoform X2 [Anguilla anguilla]|uniref:prominin-1-A isoform X2 n=1 Tax=Anguilla anguilla TaxID=7936 RepID=UPI0015A86EA9|nr:prominin-1-A isoform X2 [Anguilla anguilla]
MLMKVVLMFLLCWGFTSSEPPVAAPQPRSQTLDFGFVPAGVYETLAYYEPGPIGLLFHMVHGFLYVVQPNPFPKDLVVKVAQNKLGSVQAEYQKPENVVLTLQVMYYEVGFIVCAALGLLFVLLVPLVGLCFCMCRCCDNCGGEMHQRQRKNAECKRGFFATLLFTTSVFITAGVLCAYAANQNLSSQLKGMRKLVNSNMRDLHTFANQTPAQIDYLIGQYVTAKKRVVSDLENIGPLLGGKIHQELEKEVIPALDGVLNMAGAMRETKEALENVSVSLEILQDGSSRLAFNLSAVRSRLSSTLKDPACALEDAAPVCASIRSSLAQLGIGANYSKLSDVSEQLARVNNVLKTDLSNIVQKGYLSFNDTPYLVKTQTQNIVAKVRNMLDDLGSNITSFSKTFPVEDSLSNFIKYISHTQSKIEDYYPQIDQIDFYRWISCIALCCMVVLILAFNFLGLFCGITGYDKHASPTTRGCISNTGGNLLMAGVGFSFIFSWVLMGVVVATFVVGGNLEKLVCEPYETKQLYEVVDTPYLVNPAWKNFIPGFLYQKPEIDLTAGNLYRSCKDNQGIYSALHLDSMFNVTAFLSSSVYTDDVSGTINNVRVDLSSIVLLESEGRHNLIQFSNTGVNEINYSFYLEEVNKGATMVDLLSFSNELEAQIDKLKRGALESALRGHVSSIRQIHSQLVVPMEQSMKYVRARSTLNQSALLLQKTVSDLPNSINNVLNAIDAAQFLIAQNATYVVKKETDTYRQSIVDYFKQYTDWVKTSLEMEVATCKPLSNIVDTVEIVACSFIVDSLNTFWFGLGCCAIFLIPSVILSVKLAKFYRRMDTEDVYDDIETIPMKTMEIGNNGYHNERLQGIPNPVMTSIPSYDTVTRFPRASAPPRHADW